MPVLVRPDTKITERGKREGEITLLEVARLWGLGRTRTWELITKGNVVPYRQDFYRIYVKKEDAEGYQHVSVRGRPSHKDWVS